MHPRAARLGIALRFGVIALVLACAACGSTVPPSARGSLAQGGFEPGLGPPAAQGSSAQSPGTFVPGVPGSSGGGSFTGGGPLPSGSGPSGFKVPGVTANAIYIGATFQQDQSAANGGIFGAGNLDTGDAQDYYNAVLAEVNGAGGIAGRRVIPIFAELKATSQQTIDQQYQAACEKWIRDSRYGVFAIMEAGVPVVRECARKAGVVVSGEGGSSVPNTFRQYPNYVEISSINLVRQGSVTVDGLAREGYFDKGARIGLVTWDDSVHRTAVEDGYVPALRKLGLSLATPPVYAHIPESAPDIAGTSRDVSGAVLRFSSQNISHVLLVDGQAGVCAPGCMTTVFMREADAQRFHPRYGLNQENEPVAGQEGGLYPASQLRRSVAVLWRGADAAADEGIAPNAARARCYAIFKKHGITLNNPNAELSALSACGNVLFLQAAFARITGAISAGAYISGVNRLARSHADPFAYGTYFAADRHDGIAAVRNARFDQTSGHFVYTTGAYPV